MLSYINDWRYLDTELDTIAPWYTLECLQWLKTLDLEGRTVFEYGVGDSTFWWRAVVGSTGKVYGIDSNQKWAEKTVSPYSQDKEEYLTYILKAGIKYDFIIIDGIYRDECTRYALEAVKNGGYIIIDNYHQASVDLPPAVWEKTDRLLFQREKTIFLQNDILSNANHPDWKTMAAKITL